MATASYPQFTSRGTASKPIRQEVDYWRTASPAKAAGSFLLRDFELRPGHFHWHHHPEWEIHEVLAGEGKRLVLDTNEKFRAGDLCLLGNDLPHCFHVPKDAPIKVETRVLQFHAAVLGNLLSVNADLHPVRELLLASRGGLLILGGLRMKGHRRLAELKQIPPGHPLRFTRLLELLIELSAGLKNRSLLRPLSDFPAWSAHDLIFSRLVDHLETHFAEPLTQKFLAERVDLKPAAFSRWFKRRAGTTFEKFLTTLRLRKAALQLMETEEPVGNVAVLSGFLSATHFHRVFQERYRETPSEFRERIRAARGDSKMVSRFG
ncbi:MAG: helix-turn-helix domain-containing protein [Spirochaetia bacterium]|nr:helix-turn-helix domain-containing protein [Spirochaetia bacterium]